MGLVFSKMRPDLTCGAPMVRSHPFRRLMAGMQDYSKYRKLWVTALFRFNNNFIIKKFRVFSLLALLTSESKNIK